MSQIETTQISWTAFDHQMMGLALALAKKGQFTARPNPMVGCVITQHGEVVAQGWHQQFGQSHAEVNALRAAGDKAKGSCCYVTLEPCAHQGKTGPCAQALIDAGVKEVVAAMQDPNPKVAGGGFAMLRKAGIQVRVGLLEAQAKSLNAGFVSSILRQRPFVTCKLAMSLDGRTALANGQSQWITGPAARADVQKLRAQQDAIITGAGTLLSDNPSLTVRSSDCAGRWFSEAEQHGFTQPKRVLLDRQARATGGEKLFADTAEVIWVTDERPSTHLEPHVTHWQTPDSIHELLSALAGEQCNNVLVEAGHRLAGRFLQAQVIDELVIYMAPKLMGNEAQGLVELTVNEMPAVRDLTLTDLRKVGDDVRLTYRISD